MALETGVPDAESEEEDAAAAPAQVVLVQRPCPTGLTEPTKAVAEVLAAAGRGLDLDDVARDFTSRGRWRDRLPTLLDTLVTLGCARLVDGRWVGVGT